MIKVRQTPTFTDWLAELRDASARARIVVRIRRMEAGNLGDVKPVGGGVSEIRINHGPGYRIYFIQSGDALVVLLCGGSKRRQRADIMRAKQLAAEI